MANFQDRVIGAMKLQGATFEEVERDHQATGQALTVVLLASLASSIFLVRFGLLRTAVSVMVWETVAWVVMTGAIWALGTRVIPGRNTKADFWQVLRPVGFAQAPKIFLVLAILPLVGRIVRIVVLLWALAATVIAVKQALDYDDIAKAIIVCVLAIAVFWVVMSIVGPGYGWGWY